MADVWPVTALAHGLLLGAYLWIAVILFKGNQRAGQWRANPLATATFAIFLSCAIGHGLHTYHSVENYLGIESSSTSAARIAMSDPILAFWSVLTAGIAVWYLSQRSRLKILSEGAPLCEDMARRQERSNRLHAPVQAAIIEAQQHLDAGDHEAATRSIDEALQVSRQIMTELIGETGGAAIRPGDLRRSHSP